MKYKILTLLLLLGLVTYGNEMKPIELKKSSTAVGASLAVTLLPSLPLLASVTGHDVDGLAVTASIILSASGFIIGPSAGHFYAGNRNQGNKSIGFRSACGFIGLLGGVGALGSIQSEHWGAMDNWIKVSVISGVLIFGSALLDICTCPQSVEKYNKSIRDQGGLYLTPEIDLTNESYGLSLSYRF